MLKDFSSRVAFQVANSIMTYFSCSAMFHCICWTPVLDQNNGKFEYQPKLYDLNTKQSDPTSYWNVQIYNFYFIFIFQVFVFLLSLLVTLQQALSSGYLNSVITTIEKRYEIPSSISGIIASMYEIGNVITVIFVSYLGSRRHIPVWIGMGKNCDKF